MDERDPYLMDVTKGLPWWVNGETIKQPAQILTISNVKHLKTGAFEADNKHALQFEEKEYEGATMTLNTVNFRRMVEWLGTYAPDWVGKRVLLYLTRTTMGGKIVPGIRLWLPDSRPPETVFDKSGQPVELSPPPKTRKKKGAKSGTDSDD